MLPTNTDPAKTLYVLDGSGYIFRAFYATPQMSTRSGLPTNALYAFVRMLVRLIKNLSPRYLVVAFDTKPPNFRHEMFPAYKANRRECPLELIPQLPYFRKIVSSMGLVSVEQEGFEADDVIATIVSSLRGQLESVVVISADKDLAQLVDPTVCVWDAMRDSLLDEKGVMEKFGVCPERIIDYLALAGDSSDNIPGAQGVGTKTAQRLVAELGSVAEILSDLERVERIDGLRGAASVRKKLEASRDNILLSRRLVDLERGVEPYASHWTLKDCERASCSGEQLRALFCDLEFSTLDDVASFIGANSQCERDPEATLFKERLILADSFVGFVNEISQLERFAFDTETTGLDTNSAELLGLSFCWRDDEACFLPVRTDGRPQASEFVSLEDVRNHLSAVFASEQIGKTAFNAKFDIKVLARQGIEVKGLYFDGLLASHLLHPDKRQHNLAHLSVEYLKHPMTSYKELVGDDHSLADLPISKVSSYACDDAWATWKLTAVLSAEMKEADSVEGVDLEGALEKVELPLIPVLSDMEQEGILLDGDYLNQMDKELASELFALEEQIYLLAGHRFNINSPSQLSAILFEHLGIATKGVKRTKSSFSTDAKTLSHLAHEYPIAQKLLDYRELHKLRTTYVSSLSRMRDNATGRVHTSFNQAIAATGRLSSSEPNLQNIPIRGERGRQIRRAFIAEPGKVLISADYSQIELRVLAHLSGDPAMCQAFRDGADIHKLTADELLSGRLAQGLSAEDARRIAKTINFGVIYGLSAFRLAEQLGISRTGAAGFIDGYFRRYGVVKEYLLELERQVDHLGFTCTMFGRRRLLSELDTSGRDDGYARRSLVNFPIQGSAAEIVKLAMVSLHKSLLSSCADRARMILQVHDELVIEVAKEAVEEAVHIVRKEMEGAVALAVPVVVDIKVKDTWGE